MFVPWSPSEPLVVTDWVSKLACVLLYVLYYGRYTKPRARERARVTRARVAVVTRLCARVGQSVLFRIEKSPCRPGESSDPLIVTD